MIGNILQDKKVLFYYSTNLLAYKTTHIELEWRIANKNIDANNISIKLHDNQMYIQFDCTAWIIKPELT